MNTSIGAYIIALIFLNFAQSCQREKSQEKRPNDSTVNINQEIYTENSDQMDSISNVSNTDKEQEDSLVVTGSLGASNKWIGTYNYEYGEGGEIDTEGNQYPGIFIGYSILLRKDSCFFTGNGHMTWIDYICSVKEHGDTLLIYPAKKREGYDISPKTEPVIRLFLKNEEYYLISSRIEGAQEPGVKIGKSESD